MTISLSESSVRSSVVSTKLHNVDQDPADGYDRPEETTDKSSQVGRPLPGVLTY